METLTDLRYVIGKVLVAAGVDLSADPPPPPPHRHTAPVLHKDGNHISLKAGSTEGTTHGFATEAVDTTDVASALLEPFLRISPLGGDVKKSVCALPGGQRAVHPGVRTHGVNGNANRLAHHSTQQHFSIAPFTLAGYSEELHPVLEAEVQTGGEGKGRGVRPYSRRWCAQRAERAPLRVSRKAAEAVAAAAAAAQNNVVPHQEPLHTAPSPGHSHASSPCSVGVGVEVEEEVEEGIDVEPDDGDEGVGWEGGEGVEDGADGVPVSPQSQASGSVRSLPASLSPKGACSDGFEIHLNGTLLERVVPHAVLVDRAVADVAQLADTGHPRAISLVEFPKEACAGYVLEAPLSEVEDSMAAALATLAAAVAAFTELMTRRKATLRARRASPRGRVVEITTISDNLPVVQVPPLPAAAAGTVRGRLRLQNRQVCVNGGDGGGGVAVPPEETGKEGVAMSIQSLVESNFATVNSVVSERRAVRPEGTLVAACSRLRTKLAAEKVRRRRGEAPACAAWEAEVDGARSLALTPAPETPRAVPSPTVPPQVRTPQVKVKKLIKVTRTSGALTIVSRRVVHATLTAEELEAVQAAEDDDDDDVDTHVTQGAQDQDPKPVTPVASPSPPVGTALPVACSPAPVSPPPPARTPEAPEAVHTATPRGRTRQPLYQPHIPRRPRPATNFVKSNIRIVAAPREPPATDVSTRPTATSTTRAAPAPSTSPSPSPSPQMWAHMNPGQVCTRYEYLYAANKWSASTVHASVNPVQLRSIQAALLGRATFEYWETHTPRRFVATVLQWSHPHHRGYEGTADAIQHIKAQAPASKTARAQHADLPALFGDVLSRVPEEKIGYYLDVLTYSVAHCFHTQFNLRQKGFRVVQFTECALGEMCGSYYRLDYPNPFAPSSNASSTDVDSVLCGVLEGDAYKVWRGTQRGRVLQEEAEGLAALFGAFAHYTWHESRQSVLCIVTKFVRECVLEVELALCGIDVEVMEGTPDQHPSVKAQAQGRKLHGRERVARFFDTHVCGARCKALHLPVVPFLAKKVASKN